ncbi:hypothetical protein ACEK07_04710 [Alcanivoracaceae bacterium MT1]
MILALATTLLPTTSFAILDEEGSTNRESPYRSFLADIELVSTDSSGQYYSSHGTGAFIAPSALYTIGNVVAVAVVAFAVATCKAACSDHPGPVQTTETAMVFEIKNSRAPKQAIFLAQPKFQWL